MRRGPSLTVRGRCLLAAGVTLLALGFVLGEVTLVQLAVFVLLLIALSALSVARSRFRIAARRAVSPPRVPLGAEADVALEVTNTARRRGGSWSLTEQLPGQLGREPTFWVDGLAPGATVTLRYRVHGTRRGRYALGPLRVRVVDPFGLVARSVSGLEAGSLVVVPRVRPLTLTGPDGTGGSGGAGRRSIAVHGEDDVSTRPYRSGDDLRKVHWRATARTGEMMVRLEERPWRATTTLVLDTRAGGHLTGPARDSLEWVVEAAASIGTAYLRAGSALRVVTDVGDLGPAAGSGGLSAETLLDVLAGVRPSASTDLIRAGEQLPRSSGPGAVIALLGAVGVDDVAPLTRIHGQPALAVLVDIASYLPRSGSRRGGTSTALQTLRTDRDDAAALLRAAGWRVGTAEGGRPVEQVWTELSGAGSQLGRWPEEVR